jgi:hypothetical protein
MASLFHEEAMGFSPVNALEDTAVPQSDVELQAADDRDVNTRNSPDSHESQVSSNSSHHPAATTSRKKATKKTGKSLIR